MTAKTAADFRIEQVQKATVNGKQVKIFTTYAKQGDAFVHVGKFTAPIKTANKNLWLIAAESENDADWDNPDSITHYSLGELTAAKTISQIVATALEGQSQMFLEDVAAHGIHNIINDYQGDTDEDYGAYSDEFERQSKAALAVIEAQRDDE